MNDNAPERPAIQPLPSPCVGVCTLKGDYCYGCGRTADEIAAWGGLSAAEQSAVWAVLPGRLAGFGFRTFRLAASHRIVAAFVARTFRETRGRWRLVTPAVEGRCVVGTDRSAIDSPTELRLKAHEKVRIFGFQRDAERAAMDTAVLVLPKGLAAREAESLAPPQRGTVRLAAPDRYSRAWLVGERMDADSLAATFDGLDWRATAARLPEALADRGIRLKIANALGSIETRTPVFTDEAPSEDANAPADIRVSKAFIAGAIFEADDPDWLAAALAPA